jgi:hypothetical protein
MRGNNNLFRSLLCLLTLCVAQAVFAQNAKEKAEQEEARRQQLQRKTFALVDEIANGALSLKLPENRSWVLAAAADLMWDYDEKRARNIFWDAVNTVNMTNLAGSSEPTKKLSPKEKERALTAYYVVFGLRKELLLKVARRDPQLALDMLRSTHQPEMAIPYPGYYLPSERELEQEIAGAAASRDPKIALEIARASLNKGFSFQLFTLLESVNQRDAELGSKFAGEIISKLQTRNISNDYAGFRIAVDLVLMSRTRPAAEVKENEARPLKLEQNQRADIVQLLANAALGISANPNLLYSIDEILPEFQEFAPERLPLLRKKLAAFNETLNKEQRGWTQHNTLVRAGNPEAMLRGAVGLDEEQSLSLQQQAILMAVYRRRADSLRELINTEVEDEGRRRLLSDALDTELVNQAVHEGNIEGLRKLLPQVRLREERARAMAQMAVLFEKKGEHDEAVKLLDEARAMIKIDLESEGQTNALLALVSGYAIVEPAKAFVIIEKTIDRANSQLSKLLLLDKIVRSGAIKKGEIVFQKSGLLLSDHLMFRYGNGIGALAAVDFDRTKAAADRFDRHELRLLARLMLARSLIEFTKNKRSHG